ncbi:hypothetical protein SAMD00019534_084300 [Acytostelium subglobosum LB1]|uniref:hypothetical protein n=1 Tax=Acytostelium subglobosum LB1 TaxID=1410327 RepID=UPI000644D4C9|nr:hypothetical protein SAMD00019534_084300 [Acytostelium subglobosum LB1]GAM25255.1 hypothetical protein SAMD00019534_084300 [Acytostelium subglobosum LB1]|eukprot:XP_012751775.1 hypothetical protein SAMD00019534_084300 [Acytostelium subglobosum LB1]
MDTTQLVKILTSSNAAERFTATQKLVALLNTDDGSASLVTMLKGQISAGNLNSGWAIANSVATISSTLMQFVPEIGPIAGRAMVSMWQVVMSVKNGTDITKNVDKTSQVITAYKTLIKASIDTAIETYDSEALHTAYEGASTYLTAYTAALSVFLANPTVASNQDTLKDSLSNVEKQYATIIAACNKETHAVAELYMYAMCASIRLSLLRDACLHGVEWGYTAEYITTYFLPQFTTCLKEYTNHCIDTYKTAVTNLKTAAAASDVNLFNTINTLRNGMITYVFDLVAVWPLLNPTKFPDGVNIPQRTRLLMSDVVGLPVNPDKLGTKDYYTATFDQIHNIMISQNYYLYRGEHDKFASQADETGNRLLWIQNSFKTGYTNEGLPSWASTNTQVGPPGGVDPIDTTKYPIKSIGFSDIAEETIKIYADIIPRSFECSIGGDITGGPFDNHQAVLDGNKDIILGTENSWHCAVDQYNFPNMKTPFSYQTVAVENTYINIPYKIPWNQCLITSYQFPGHHLYHPFGLGVNKDPMVRPGGTMDSACIAFAPLGLNNSNYVYNGMGATLLDPIKKDSMSGVTFIEDSFMPGLPEVVIAPGGSIVYKLDPIWLGMKMFYLRFIVKATTATKLHIDWNDTSYDIDVPVSDVFDVLDAGTVPAIILAPLNPPQNKFTLSVPAGSAALSIRSIILLSTAKDAIPCSIL